MNNKPTNELIEHLDYSYLFVGTSFSVEPTIFPNVKIRSKKKRSQNKSKFKTINEYCYLLVFNKYLHKYLKDKFQLEFSIDNSELINLFHFVNKYDPINGFSKENVYISIPDPNGIYWNVCHIYISEEGPLSEQDIKFSWEFINENKFYLYGQDRDAPVNIINLEKILKPVPEEEKDKRKNYYVKMPEQERIKRVRNRLSVDNGNLNKRTVLNNFQQNHTRKEFEDLKVLMDEKHSERENHPGTKLTFSNEDLSDDIEEDQYTDDQRKGNSYNLVNNDLVQTTINKFIGKSKNKNDISYDCYVIMSEPYGAILKENIEDYNLLIKTKNLLEGTTDPYRSSVLDRIEQILHPIQLSQEMQRCIRFIDGKKEKQQNSKDAGNQTKNLQDNTMTGQLHKENKIIIENSLDCDRHISSQACSLCIAGFRYTCKRHGKYHGCEKCIRTTVKNATRPHSIRICARHNKYASCEKCFIGSILPPIKSPRFKDCESRGCKNQILKGIYCKDHMKPKYRPLFKREVKSVVNKDGEKTIKGPITLKDFNVNIQAPKSINTNISTDFKIITFNWKYDNTTNVQIAGSFNDWVPTKDMSFKLTPGSYEYKFIVNGIWCYDLEKPNNGNNNIIEVKATLKDQLTLKRERNRMNRDTLGRNTTKIGLKKPIITKIKTSLANQKKYLKCRIKDIDTPCVNTLKLSGFSDNYEINHDHIVLYIHVNQYKNKLNNKENHVSVEDFSGAIKVYWYEFLNLLNEGYSFFAEDCNHNSLMETTLFFNFNTHDLYRRCPDCHEEITFNDVYNTYKDVIENDSRYSDLLCSNCSIDGCNTLDSKYIEFRRKTPCEYHRESDCPYEPCNHENDKDKQGLNLTLKSTSQKNLLLILEETITQEKTPLNDKPNEEDGYLYKRVLLTSEIREYILKGFDPTKVNLAQINDDLIMLITENAKTPRNLKLKGNYIIHEDQRDMSKEYLKVLHYRNIKPIYVKRLPRLGSKNTYEWNQRNRKLRKWAKKFQKWTLTEIENNMDKDAQWRIDCHHDEQVYKRLERYISQLLVNKSTFTSPDANKNEDEILTNDNKVTLNEDQREEPKPDIDLHVDREEKKEKDPFLKLYENESWLGYSVNIGGHSFKRKITSKEIKIITSLEAFRNKINTIPANYGVPILARTDLIEQYFDDFYNQRKPWMLNEKSECTVNTVPGPLTCQHGYCFIHKRWEACYDWVHDNNSDIKFCYDKNVKCFMCDICPISPSFCVMTKACKPHNLSEEEEALYNNASPKDKYNWHQIEHMPDCPGYSANDIQGPYCEHCDNEAKDPLKEKLNYIMKPDLSKRAHIMSGRIDIVYKCIKCNRYTNNFATQYDVNRCSLCFYLECKCPCISSKGSPDGLHHLSSPIGNYCGYCGKNLKDQKLNTLHESVIKWFEQEQEEKKKSHLSKNEREESQWSNQEPVFGSFSSWDEGTTSSAKWQAPISSTLEKVNKEISSDIKEKYQPQDSVDQKPEENRKGEKPNVDFPIPTDKKIIGSIKFDDSDVQTADDIPMNQIQNLINKYTLSIPNCDYMKYKDYKDKEGIRHIILDVEAGHKCVYCKEGDLFKRNKCGRTATLTGEWKPTISPRPLSMNQKKSALSQANEECKRILEAQIVANEPDYSAIKIILGIHKAQFKNIGYPNKDDSDIIEFKWRKMGHLIALYEAWEKILEETSNLSLDEDAFMEKLYYIHGPWGTGKSYQIRRFAKPQDLVVVATRQLLLEYLIKFARKKNLTCPFNNYTDPYDEAISRWANDHMGKTIPTIKTYEIATISEVSGIVWVDECHLNSLGYSLKLFMKNQQSIDAIIAVGDHLQIKAVDFNKVLTSTGSTQLKTFKDIIINLPDDHKHLLNVTFRNGADTVAKMIKHFGYETSMRTATDVLETYNPKPKEYKPNNHEMIIGHYNDLIEDLTAVNLDRKARTTHRSQGAEWDHIAFYEVNKTPSSGHDVVALTRHKLSCNIVDRTDTGRLSHILLKESIEMLKSLQIKPEHVPKWEGFIQLKMTPDDQDEKDITRELFAFTPDGRKIICTCSGAWSNNKGVVYAHKYDCSIAIAGLNNRLTEESKIQAEPQCDPQNVTTFREVLGNVCKEQTDKIHSCTFILEQEISNENLTSLSWEGEGFYCDAHEIKSLAVYTNAQWQSVKKNGEGNYFRPCIWCNKYYMKCNMTAQQGWNKYACHTDDCKIKRNVTKAHETNVRCPKCLHSKKFNEFEWEKKCDFSIDGWTNCECTDAWHNQKSSGESKPPSPTGEALWSTSEIGTDAWGAVPESKTRTKSTSSGKNTEGKKSTVSESDWNNASWLNTETELKSKWFHMVIPERRKGDFNTKFVKTHKITPCMEGMTHQYIKMIKCEGCRQPKTELESQKNDICSGNFSDEDDPHEYGSEFDECINCMINKDDVEYDEEQNPTLYLLDELARKYGNDTKYCTIKKGNKMSSSEIRLSFRLNKEYKEKKDVSTKIVSELFEKLIKTGSKVQNDVRNYSQTITDTDTNPFTSTGGRHG